MKVSDRILNLSTAEVAACIVILLLRSAITNGASQCSEYDFACENGECIDPGLWCDDTFEDCSDGTDEKYCKKAHIFDRDPNRCPETYFKCNNGPCIPMTGRCDSYADCDDSSDENNCSPEMTPVSRTGYHTTASVPVLPPKSKIQGNNAVRFFASLNVSQNSVQLEEFFGYSSSDFSSQRKKAKNWLLSQRRDDFGWGEETPRAMMALYFCDEYPVVKSTDVDMLMIKQLEMQLSLELARSAARPIKLTEVTLYINALLASCKNPKNFYGDNLVSVLRHEVNDAQMGESFVNPSIYYTLCINNATTYEDMTDLHTILLSRNSTINMIDMQALAFLTTACIYRKTNFLNTSTYDTIKMEFLRKLKVHGFPGNVHEAALLFQALQEMKITITGLMDYILKQQLLDGSFGDLLSTYRVLSMLSGRNMTQINDHCEQRDTPGLIPLEVLKNVKSKKMHVQYFLNYGFPPEVTQTIQIHVAEGTNFLNIMRLAQEINPKYRFKLSENREVPVVYSVGGMPNDVEKGMYWILYKEFRNNSENANEPHWVPYDGDIQQLILAEGEKVLLWYRPL